MRYSPLYIFVFYMYVTILKYNVPHAAVCAFASHSPLKFPQVYPTLNIFYNYFNDIQNVIFEFRLYIIQTNAYFTYSLSLKITLRCAAI